MMHRFIANVFKLIFGDFNGVQVFLYPLTLFWWIDSHSFLYTITGLLTIRKHFFPLGLFLLLLLYVAFLILKYHGFIFREQPQKQEFQLNAFYEVVIEIHVYLLIALISFGLLYIFAAFMGYYYAIRIPLKLIYPLAFRGFSITLIIYYMVVYSWLKPYLDRNLSFGQARRLLRFYHTKHVWAYRSYLLVMVLGIFFCSYVYNVLIQNLFLPLTEAFKLNLKFILIPVNNVYSLVYNVFIFGAAFVLSNILFSPLVVLFTRLAAKIHPLYLKHAKAYRKT